MSVSDAIKPTSDQNIFNSCLFTLEYRLFSCVSLNVFLVINLSVPKILLSIRLFLENFKQNDT